MSSAGCPCDPNGSRDIKCNQTVWQCECYPNVTGRMCDTCAQEGYYGPTEDHHCKRCTCMMENTEECNKVSCSLYEQNHFWWANIWLFYRYFCWSFSLATLVITGYRIMWSQGIGSCDHTVRIMWLQGRITGYRFMWSQG